VIKLQFRDQPERFISLAASSITIGRDEGNDLTIADPSISDFHAELLNDSDGLAVIDLLSATGTFVNDERVRTRRQLRGWDILRLGNVQLEINDPTVNRPSDWALSSQSDLLAGQFFTLQPVTVIGRGTECDVKIDDAMLSRRHAQLTIDGEVLRVRDMGSANGIYVNEERVDQATLRPGDKLRLGSRSFMVVGPASARHGAGGDEDPTVMSGLAVRAASRQDGGPRTEILPSSGLRAYLVEQTSILGAPARLTLQGPRFRLGRDEENDIVIPDSSISRVHAMLTPVAGAWSIQDTQSSNGVLVNGKRVKTTTLRNGDEIRLGRASFLYCCDPD
jgi:pSer/pThr/pTyr-binding forkhead associated (FHA) protein